MTKALVATGLLAACSPPESKTALNTEGPPMVRQVFMTERVMVNNNLRIQQGQLAFGAHEDLANDDGVVTTALAIGGQEIRIVVDELLVGNDIEELECADGSWSRIPPGTTPDDIEKCAGPVESLLDCTKVCIAGEGHPSLPQGSPIGIQDKEPEDTAPDRMRMIDYGGGELAVSVVCDGTMIPMSPTESFWSPAGNQQIPAGPLQYRGLGPALVLIPQRGMRTGSNCVINFRDEVVDTEGLRVCAPEGGDVSKDCEPGDTSKISFGVEALRMTTSIPEDGDTNVDATSPAFMLLEFNAGLDGTTLETAISLAINGTPVDNFYMTWTAEDPTTIVMGVGTPEAPLPLQPSTTYTLTITTDLTDELGGALPAEEVITFTTEDIAPTPDAGPTPDADLPDAA